MPSQSAPNSLPRFVRWRFADAPLKRLLWGGMGVIVLGGLLVAPLYHPPLLKPWLKTEWPRRILQALPGYDNALLAAEIPQITVQQLHQQLVENPEDIVLVDVRSDAEVAIARIPNAIHIPIELIEAGWAIDQIKSLLQDAESPQLILHCYSGHRSHRALVRLREEGMEGSNLKGGIKAWREQIDPSLPKQLLPK